MNQDNINNNNINISENNNRERNVANDEHKFDFQIHDNAI